MMLVRRRNSALAPLVTGSALVLATILVVPVVAGAIAGSLLGYGWRKGIGVGIVFSAVAGAVRAVLGSMGAKTPVVKAEEPPGDEP